MSFEPDGVSRKEYDRLIAQVADLTKLRLEDELVHGNVMGRIAVALFGDQNNRTDEECVARAAEIGYQLTGTQQALFQAQEAAKMLRSEVDALRDQEEFNETALKGYRNNINDLKHDIARHVQITADQAQEMEKLRQDLAAARANLEIAECALLAHGYRKSCDIPACNCGDQWHHGGNAVARLVEIRDAISERESFKNNGKTILQCVKECVRSDIDLTEARARNKECDLLLSRVLHELAGSASLCWEPKPTGVFATELALGFVEDAIKELRAVLAGEKK